MKKLIVLFVLTIIFLISCSNPEFNDIKNEKKTNTLDGTAPLMLAPAVKGIGTYGPFTDYSGQVETIMHVADTMGYENSITAYLGPDEVLVGGGAYIWAYDGWAGMLTGSFPEEDNPPEGEARYVGWTAQSKSHIVPSYHYLGVIAVGLRLKDSSGNYIPADTVRQYIKVFQSVSGTAAHPEATIEMPATYSILSGGAQVINPFGQPGSFLTKTKFYRNILNGAYWDGWSAKSKDHYISSPSQIRCWSIGILRNQNIYGFGYLSVTIRQKAVQTYGGSFGFNSIASTSGNCVIGVGAQITYNLSGRMLVTSWINADNSGVYVVDKDHYVADSGWLSIDLIEICKGPNR